MDRAAFARALKFLNYKPVATYSALVAGILSSIFFVLLLVVLALFADLVVNRGEAPCYVNLSAREQQAFLDKLAAEENADVRKGWTRKAAALGFPTALANLAGSSEEGLSGPDVEKRRQLLWMTLLPDIVSSRVNSEAGESVRGEIESQVTRHDPVVALNQNLPDFGILSLVVRTRSLPQGWVASVIADWNAWTWSRGNLVYLQGLLLLALTVALVRTGLLFLSSYLAGLATIHAITRLRRSIYHQTYRLGTLAFRALGPSEAVGVSTRHLEAVHEGLFVWLTAFFREPTKFVLLLLFAMLVHFWLALAFLLFAVLVWLVGGQIATYFRRRGRSAEHRAADELAHMQESLMMMRLVKIYLMEHFNQSRVERQLRKYADAQMERYKAEAIYVPLFTLLGQFAAVVLLLLAGLIVLNGHVGVTSAVVLVTALVCLYWPVVSFLAARRVLKRSRQSARVLFDFLGRTGSVGQVVEAEFLPALSKVLEFDNVALTEPGTERKLLKGVSLSIKAGEMVALVGPDEMEKHALVYLLPRFLDPTSGEIRIDKKNLRWVTLDSLRAQTAMVLQHNLVFNDTVGNNIGCGDPAYPLPRVIEAAKVAHAHQFIQKLPQGYETVIGEMGHALSNEQRFLIALARAILRDPAILVIEEPSQPMSEDMKNLVDDTYSRFLHGRTVIFLPHRLSTIRRCDRVYLLYQGKIAGAGEHRELLAKSDLYKHLQYLEFNEFASITLPPATPGEGAA